MPKKGKKTPKKGFRKDEWSELISPAIFLVRHGKSAAQAASNRMDPSLLDCFLSRTGEQQAKHLTEWLAGLAPDVVFTSPLSRCIQTTCCMRQGTSFDTKIIAVPEISEISRSSVHENTGRPLKKIQNCSILNRFYEPLNEIDFSRVGSAPWWNAAKEKKEIEIGLQKFLNDLCQMSPDLTVVIVCHHNVIKQFESSGRFRAANCQPYRCSVAKNVGSGDRYEPGHLRLLVTEEGKSSKQSGNASTDVKLTKNSKKRKG